MEYLFWWTENSARKSKFIVLQIVFTGSMHSCLIPTTTQGSCDHLSQEQGSSEQRASTESECRGRAQATRDGHGDGELSVGSVKGRVQIALLALEDGAVGRSERGIAVDQCAGVRAQLTLTEGLLTVLQPAPHHVECISVGRGVDVSGHLLLAREGVAAHITAVAAAEVNVAHLIQVCVGRVGVICLTRVNARTRRMILHVTYSFEPSTSPSWDGCTCW